jgi:hypothetical protein
MPCLGVAGQERKQFHNRRHRRAVAQLVSGEIDRPDLRNRGLGFLS